METVTISKDEYNRLKKLEQVDHDLIQQLTESLEDAKHGRIRRVA
jgi:predicted CopG family antitoxin